MCTCTPGGARVAWLSKLIKRVDGDSIESHSAADGVETEQSRHGAKRVGWVKGGGGEGGREMTGKGEGFLNGCRVLTYADRSQRTVAQAARAMASAVVPLSGTVAA